MVLILSTAILVNSYASFRALLWYYHLHEASLHNPWSSSLVSRRGNPWTGSLSVWFFFLVPGHLPNSTDRQRGQFRLLP